MGFKFNATTGNLDLVNFVPDFFYDEGTGQMVMTLADGNTYLWDVDVGSRTFAFENDDVILMENGDTFFLEIL